MIVERTHITASGYYWWREPGHKKATSGQEAAAFLRACEAIHLLLEQGTLEPDDRVLIEVSMTDLREKLEMYP